MSVKNPTKVNNIRNSTMFYKAEEHTKHNAAGYTTLEPYEHTNGHNKVAGFIHRTICKRGVTCY